LSGPKLPTDKNRTILVGRTGTGKTVAGLWHLSNYDLSRPWVVLNFKNDEHIDSIPNTVEIDFDFVPGKKDKGLFILRPLPTDMKPSRLEASRLETYLWKIWARENCGVFCDEGFMVGQNDAFDALLTQGRSKHIPMIVCTQRPVWLSRFCFSEATFIQVFDLNDIRDIQTIEGFVPLEWDREVPLGPHQSWYYEIDSNRIFRFNPCPDINELRKRFATKLHRKWVLI
jgi:hypothetical protein